MKNFNCDENMFFILGNPRSGTTLLRLMLNSHGDITVPPECGFYHWLSKKYYNKNFFLLNTFLADYICDLQNSKKIETWNIDFDRVRNNISNLKPDNYNKLSAAVYLSYAEKFNKTPKFIGDKNNYYIHYLDDILRINPCAKFIHIIRDSRNVVASYRNVNNLETKSPYKPKLPQTVKESAIDWNTNNNKILLFLEKLPQKQHVSIRFEDLILNSEIVLSKICDWLGTKFDTSMLDYYKHNIELNIEPKSTLDWKKKTLEPIDKSKALVNMKNLTFEDLDLVSNITKDLLLRFGYSFNDN